MFLVFDCNVPIHPTVVYSNLLLVLLIWSGFECLYCGFVCFVFKQRWPQVSKFRSGFRFQLPLGMGPRF